MELDSPWSSGEAAAAPQSGRIDPGPIPRPGASANRRAAVACIGPLVVWGAQQVPLVPGDDLGVQGSIGAIGLSPVLSAFIAVEIAALIVPAWRRLRTSGPGGRARLGVAVVVLAVAFTVLQSILVGYNLVDLPNVWGIAIALTGTTGLFTLVAVAIDRHGLGSGFANIIVSGFLIDTLAGLEAIWSNGLVSVSLVPTAAVVAVTVLGVLFAAGRMPATIRSAHPGARVPFIASGTSALMLYAILMVVSNALVNFEIAPLIVGIESDASLAMKTLLMIVGVVGATIVFAGPRRFSKIVERGLEVPADEAKRLARGAIVDAIRLALLFGGAMLVVDTFVARPADVSGDIPRMFVLLAIGLYGRDVWCEWHARTNHPDLVDIWPAHRPYAVPTVIHALREQGIEAFAFGVAYRTIDQVFASYVPMRIVVPEADAVRAQGIAVEILAPQ